MWVLGGIGGVVGISGYLWATNCLGFHANEAYAPLHHADDKNFLRLHIDADGALTVYPIGIDRVGRKWRFCPEADAGSPWLEPDGDEPEPHLIEAPIELRREPAAGAIRRPEAGHGHESAKDPLIEGLLHSRAGDRRRSGGTTAGGVRRGGSPARSSAVAAATFLTASSKAGVAIWPAVVTEPTLRTYWRAADSTSSAVAGGSSPRSGVMFRHMSTTIRRAQPATCRPNARRAGRPAGRRPPRCRRSR